MRLKEEQITSLARRLVQRLAAGEFTDLKAGETKVVAAATEIIQHFAATSHAIDEEVKEVMAQYSNQMESGQIDTQRMYGMIKKQVAKKNQFELDPAEQVNWLAHQIQDKLYRDDLVDYSEEGKALRQIKTTLQETLLADEVLGEKIQTKIRSLKRGVAEGSAEWHILYEKYLEEELEKRGL